MTRFVAALKFDNVLYIAFRYLESKSIKLYLIYDIV